MEISRRFGLNAANALIESGADIRGCGRCLDKMAQPDLATIISLSSHTECNSPRRGFEGVARLLERMEETAESPFQFSTAMLEYFGFLQVLVQPTGGNSDSPHDETGLPRSYFSLYINHLIIFCALSPSFDTDAFERMAIDWLKLPESVGRYNKNLFSDLEPESVFMRVAARHLKDLESGDPDRVRSANAWFDAFPIKNAG